MGRKGGRKVWSWSAGTRPYTVRVTELRPGGNLYVVRIKNGRQVMRSLGHMDRDRAKAKAMEISAELARGSEYADEGRRRRPLRLGELFDAYEAHGLHGRSETYRTGQPRRLRLVVDFLGRDREVLSISESDVHRYSEARRTGKHGSGRKIRAGTIWSELTSLKIACAWATRHRMNGGRRLLPENPLLGVSIPQERNPRRPVATEERYQALKKIAPSLHPQFALALDLAWATGHRIGAIRQLRWDDIDFASSETAPHGAIRWREDHDKTRNEHVVPMNRLAREALLEARRATPAIGKSWIFTSPKDPGKPLHRRLMSRWLRKAEKKAGIDRVVGWGWHAFRRGWATARKGFPLTDVAEAGGWRDTASLLTAYTHADPETVLGVVVHGG